MLCDVVGRSCAAAAAVTLPALRRRNSGGGALQPSADRLVAPTGPLGLDRLVNLANKPPARGEPFECSFAHKPLLF